MEAKLFAEQHAGRRIRVNNKNASPNLGIDKWPYCRVVGYSPVNGETTICVEFENKKLHPYCLFPNNGNLVKTADLIHGQCIWQVRLKHVRFLRTTKPEKKKRLFVPYPNTCRKCKSPSRNFAGYTLCSNMKCKTHAKRRLVLRPMHNYIRCKKCGNFASSTTKTKSRSSSGGHIDQYVCGEGHKWSAVFNKNDAIVIRKPSAGQIIYVYDGAKWQQLL